MTQEDSNARELKALSRTIRLSCQANDPSETANTLILAHCNYRFLRKQLVEQLHQHCPIQIRELVLPKNVETPYTTIVQELGDECPQVLMVFGLESLTNLDQAWDAMKRSVELFLKLPFPLVFWVNDEVLNKCIRVAPDFYTRSTTTTFSTTSQILKTFLQQETAKLFNHILDTRSEHFTADSAFDLGINLEQRQELEFAVEELKKNNELNAELQASKQFILARDIYASSHQKQPREQARQKMFQSRELYQKSLDFWQENAQAERQACLLLHLGWWWRRYAGIHRQEYENSCRSARDYYQQCLTIFEQINRLDLVAKFINFLGEVLRQLKEWDALNILAGKAIKLHEIYPSRLRLAAAYGYLSEVALSQSAWIEAKQCAETAISIQAQLLRTLREPNLKLSKTKYDNLIWTRYYYGNWYRFLLAQAQQHLKQESAAIQNFKKARSNFPVASHPSVYLRILDALRNLYFQQGNYLQAFQIKQEQRAIEHAYEFRAFVGAGRLQPEKLQISPNLGKGDQQVVVAEEIADSGRHQDLERLINRIERDDYKLTIIYGPSGVGKSSILQAGLIPAVTKQKIATRTVVPVLQQIYKQWIKELTLALKRSCKDYVSVNYINSSNSEETILDILNQNIQNQILTIIIFDQFEEFFFVHEDPKERQDFYSFISKCLEIPYTKVIFSLREDYIHHLLELNRLNSLDIINNNILDKNILYYLGNFSPEDAKSIIKTATEETSPLEPRLIDELVKDLSSESNEVLLIEMQIVGAQLQTEGIFTLKAYRNLGEQPKEKLVEKYLEEVIQDCGLENEEISQLVLYLLTHENQTRPFKTKAQLEEDLKAGFKDKEAIDNKLDLILYILVHSGLVLLFKNTPENFYQLAHDYLIFFIRQRQDEKLVKQLEQAIQEKTLQEEELKRIEAVNQRLEKANQKLTKTNQKLGEANHNLVRVQQESKQTLRKTRLKSGIISSIAISIFLGSSFWTNKAFQNSQILDLEREGTNTFLRFKDGAKNIDTLLSAMKVGKDLSKFIRPYTKLSNYPDLNPLLALQTTLVNLHEKNQFKGHKGWIRGVSFGFNGQQIATAGADGTVRIWNILGEEIFQLSGYPDDVNDVSFSPNGNFLVMVGKKGNIVILNLSKKIPKNLEFKNILPCESNDIKQNISCRFKSDYGEIWRVNFNPDETLFATIGEDNIARIWNLSGQEIVQLKGHQKVIENDKKLGDIVFSSDGQLIATAGLDGTARIWNLSGQQIQKFQTNKHGISGVAFSLDDRSLITTTENGRIRIWDRDSQQEITQFQAHQSPITSMSLSPDGKFIATVSWDGTAKIWDFSGQQIAKFEGHQDWIYDVAFSPDGEYLITVGRDGIARLWTLAKIREKQWQGSQQPIWGLDWSPDQNKLVTAGVDGMVKLWDISGQRFTEFKGHQGTIYGVSFSRDGQLLATVGEDSIAKLWDTSGKLLTEFKGHQGTIYGVSFSPDGDSLVTVGDEGMVKRWDTSGNLLTEFKGHQGKVYGVSFSPDGQLIATTGEDETVRLWDLSGTPLQEFKGHQDRVYSVSFSPDGQLIATAGRNDTIRLWSLSGEATSPWKANSRWVENLRFSPDGQHIVTVGNAGKAKLWSLEGKLVAEFDAYENEALNLVFLANGQFATVGADGMIKLWQIRNLEELLAQGCDWLEDYLKTHPKDQNLCLD